MTLSDLFMVLGMTVAITLIIVVVSRIHSKPRAGEDPQAGGFGSSSGAEGYHAPREHPADHGHSDSGDLGGHADGAADGGGDGGGGGGD
ncbi:MAG: hypothetical protein RL325_870 [Planctomycetota bacterium]|jgi:hypothetical protein